MQVLLTFGAVVTAMGCVVTALSANEIVNPDPGVIGADIGSGTGFVLGQVIGWAGAACLAVALAGQAAQVIGRGRR